MLINKQKNKQKKYIIHNKNPEYIQKRKEKDMDELRIGLVGTGAIGRTHIDRINKDLHGGKVVACADINAEFCKKVATQYGLKACETGEEMIADEIGRAHV